MIMQKPHKYILVAPSGTGKTTMSDALEELGLTRCITCTTRPPRDGQEVMNDAYYFEKSFDGLDMFEQSEFGGYQYGITKEDLDKGDFVILEPQGVAFYRENYPGPLTVIALHRDGIDVDPERRARDEEAGFDKVNPDITVYGETIPDMKENLVAALFSYEMNRRRETGKAELPICNATNTSNGTINLFFEDSEFGLSVMASESHVESRNPIRDDDGIACFEMANYEELFDAFTRMAQKGKECSLDFVLENEAKQIKYYCRLSPEFGKIHGEIHPYHLRMQPYEFMVKSPEEAITLAYGGYIAAENDVLGVTHVPFQNWKAVETFRSTITEGRFELHNMKPPERKKSLAEKIQDAEKVRGVQLKKMFSNKSQEFSIAADR